MDGDPCGSRTRPNTVTRCRASATLRGPVGLRTRLLFWNAGRPARSRPGNDRFGDGHDAVSPLAFGPGDGTCTRGLFVGNEACCWLHHARKNISGAPSGTRTRIASVEDSHSAFELWAHRDPKGGTPRCSPPMGSTPGCVPARLSKRAPLPHRSRAEDLRYSSGPRENPLAAGRGKTKNPALVSEGGVFCPVQGSV